MYIFGADFWAYFFSLNILQKIQLIVQETELTVLAGALIVCLVIVFRMVSKPRQNITHGSATWGTVEDAKKLGRKRKVKAIDNFIIDNIETTAKTIVAFMYNGAKKVFIGVRYHLLLIAKTRSGKGKSNVLPNLLKYPWSVICNDIKGENYLRTFEKRQKMGQEIFKIDPFGCVKEFPSNKFNPLDYLAEGDEDCVTRARDLADLIGGTPPSGEPFFSDYAKKIITMWILYICVKYEGKERSLVTLRKLATLPSDAVKKILEDAIGMDNFNGILRQNAAAILSLMGKEEGKDSATFLSVYSSVDVMTAFLDDPRIAETLSETDFDVATFRYMPSTLYIVVDASNLGVSTLFMRIIYTIAIKKNMTWEVPESMKKLGLEVNMDYPLKFIMDEFAQLKHFEVIEEAMPLAAGYGICFCIIVQSVKQLYKHYKDGANEFLNNATKVFIGAEDVETAEMISKLCGKTTVMQQSYTVKPGAFFDSKQFSYSPVARDLITPGEAIQLSVDTPILLSGDMKPLKMQAISYYEDEEFKHEYGKNYKTF